MSASHTTASNTLSRSRGAVLAITTCAAAYGIYYLYSTQVTDTRDNTGGSRLRRSNAVHRRRRTETSNESITAQLRPIPPGEDEDANVVARPLTDGDTVVDDGPGYDSGQTGRAPTAEDERNGQNIVQLLFRVSEDATRRNAYVHRGCGCNGCSVVPIRGIRYRCANCADFDLCESCEAQGIHTKTHIFYKVRIPAPSFGPRQVQPVWYTGEPDNIDRVKILPKELIAKYSRETGFERPELEAYFEQWNFMANTPWPEDPDDIRLAMDRRTFDRCLVPSGGYRHHAPSLIFDRMFAFYDSNRDDLISFSEFLRGQAYRKQKDKWHVIFAGYDIDDDGYVDRKDFLRMFRSYYVLYRQMHRDMLEGLDEQQMMSSEAHAHLSGRNALGQLFQAGSGPNPSVELRAGEGKRIRDGELEIHDGRGVMRPSANDTSSRADTIINFSSISTTAKRPVERTQSYWRFLMDYPNEEDTLDDYIEQITRQQLEASDAEWDSDDPVLLDESHVTENPFLAPAEAATISFERRRRDLNITDEDVQAVCGPEYTLSNIPESARPFIIKHTLKRHKSRYLLHERWKRRQFYTDEEEGASPPADWNDEEDLPTNSADGESSKSQFQQRPTIHSRSSSKVRFAEDMDDFDTRSNPSTSSRSVPERWGGIEISDAEKDVGKEILYQVTQQAYNELLDPLFRAKEDLAVAVLETKEERDKYRHLFNTEDFTRWARAKKFEEEKLVNPENMGGGIIERTNITNIDLNPRPVWPDIPEVEIEDVRERQLDELLAATGYEVEQPGGADAVPSLATVPDCVLSGVSRREFDLEMAVLEFQHAPYYMDDPLRAWRYYVDKENLSLDQQRELLNALQSLLPPTLSFYIDVHLKEKEQERDEATSTTSSQLSEHKDPTLPQFRPNSVSDNVVLDRPTGECQSSLESSISRSLQVKKQDLAKEEKRPSDEVLYKLWAIEGVEQEGKERGGLGKINFEEFEQCVKRLAANGKGNTMDYLGSWIEFCIP
ncbi:hypothetical protein sscle_02g022000 [Sclerotinia sclerotiorum 1980 UF-70]|uniref:Uncharacterized protein n=1 Tax=Sclerotinia sclerotiorum (strain ATCC 18683 / 1980 / Ss-1) TaxID=665079 RepID=A0A1D9PXL7_SCLS1|nr:hypothetical protein sscle_02g022000 [Sclerotinia sclerotiorum 1980 UF-70]